MEPKPVKTHSIVLLAALLLVPASALAQTPANPPEQPPPAQPAQPAAPSQPAQAQPEQPVQAQPEQPGQPAQPVAAEAPPADPVLEAAKDAFKKGDYQTALDSSKKVLETKPEELDALYIAGVASVRLGQLDPAEGYFDKLLQVEPRYPNVYFHQGHLAFSRAEQLAKDGRADEAKAQYTEAAKKFAAELERDPGQVQTLRARALALARSGDIDGAVQAYEALIAATPDSLSPYLALGSLYAELGRGDEALKMLQRAPKTNAKAAADGGFAIARTLYSKEKYDETLTFAQKMIEMSLDPRPLHGLISAAYARQGRLQEAAQELCKFMSMKPPADETEGLGEVLKMAFGGDWAEEKAPKLLPKGTLPELDRKYPPKYTPEARKDRIETQVMLMALVKADGSVGDTCTVPSGVLEQLRIYGIEQAAIDCVKKWKFLPARKDGMPVNAYYPAVVAFSLR
jgi:TonB family protein